MIFIEILIDLKRKISLRKLQKKWRKKNKHNYTQIGNYINLDVVDVGNYSYGTLNIYSWGTENEHVTIGNFVSIADNVELILGGNHRIDTITTYPLNNIVLGGKSEAITKGPIVINDDVWIGRGARILSGVEIGQGAIIAAGAIVTKNVAPYDIVGGIPAHHLKYRFEESSMRKELSDINFSKINKKFITDNKTLFYDTNLKKVISSSEMQTLKKMDKTI